MDNMFAEREPIDIQNTSEAEKEYERDSLFDKKYECPICDNQFKERTVRTGKARLISTDTDLHHKYKVFDPIKYDIIVCPRCGYAAMGIKSFKGLPPMGELYSYDEAILRYKLALFSSSVKKSKVSEQAYMCLKIAWLYRGKAEEIDKGEEQYEEKVEKCRSEENSYIERAYKGFDTAAQSEMFPICGMDETTFNYLYADLSRRLGKIDMAKKMLGTVLVSKTATAALKDKARQLKEIIYEEEDQNMP